MTYYVTGERTPRCPANQPRDGRGPGFALLVGLAIGLLGAAAAMPAAAGRPKQDDLELINPLLGPEHSQWLVGPISWMASKKEIDGYLLLTSDEQAEGFIKEFWQSRNPYPERSDNALRREFEERIAEADSQYQEGGLPGYRTPRGTVFVLYGEPEKVDYEVAPDPLDPLIEVWKYGKDAEKGLDGERPDRVYRFIKRGEVTRFYERLNAVERERNRRRLEIERMRRPIP